MTYTMEQRQFIEGFRKEKFNKIMKNHVKKLKSIIAENKESIRAIVAQDALDSDDVENYLRDVCEYGCAAGTVNGLIYLSDTKEFFIKHLEEIEELREEMEDSMGEPLKIGVPMYNWLAWFAYEEMAYRLASDDLGIEL